jgi:hypothetical protein
MCLVQLLENLIKSPQVLIVYVAATEAACI